MVPCFDLISVGRNYGAHISRRSQYCRRCANLSYFCAQDTFTRRVRLREKLATSTNLPEQLIKASYDDEFRSSRSIALGLHKRYRDVLKGGFSNNLSEFVNAGVTAYAVGCTDEGLRKELLSVCAVEEISGESYEGSHEVGLKSKLSSEEVEECILCLSLVFLAILCSPPPTVLRWSTAPAVSAEAQLQWRGFCSLIANAYYLRGMAWIPVKTLQMEQMAVAGYAEEPSVVSDRMRVVFATLETICPQWPKR